MTHRFNYVCISCNKKRNRTCTICIQALPDYIPEEQIAMWMYIYRQKLQEGK